VAKDKLLTTYSKQIKNGAVLLKETEEILLELKDSDDVKTALINMVVISNLRLVTTIAGQYHRAWPMFELLDLIQEGNIGLMIGVRKFDTTKGVKLSTYVSYWIKDKIYDYIRQNSIGVKITKTDAHRKIFDNLSREQKRLEAKGLPITNEILASNLNVKEADINDLSPILSGNGMTDIDLHTNILSSNNDNPEEILLTKEKKQLLENKVKAFKNTLHSKQRYIFNSRLLCDGACLTQTMAATILLTTQQNISGIEKVILRKARKFFNQEELKDLIYNDYNY